MVCVDISQYFYFRCAIIPILADILADAQKEKVSRIILAVFRVSMIAIFCYMSFASIAFGVIIFSTFGANNELIFLAESDRETRRQASGQRKLHFNGTM